MVDFIAIDINKFEDQMLDYIEAYYNILKGENESELIDIKNGKYDWYRKIIELLYKEENENKNKINLRKEKIIK